MKNKIIQFICPDQKGIIAQLTSILNESSYRANYRIRAASALGGAGVFVGQCGCGVGSHAIQWRAKGSA